MQLLLTNIGQIWFWHQQDRLRSDQSPLEMAPQAWRLFLDLLDGQMRRSRDFHGLEEFLQQGLLEVSTRELSESALRCRLSRNPLEHVGRVVIEYTTACSMGCLHCRNHGQTVITDRNPEPLRQSIDLLLKLGLRRFDFIGGEVIQFGDGWLDVVKHIRAHPGTTVSVISSGWFLGRREFAAAGGRRYADDTELMEDLAEAGVTHLTFSLDGPRELHDLWRRTPGLHDRILAAFQRAAEVGLRPQVSLIARNPEGSPRIQTWLSEVAGALYPHLFSASAAALIPQLFADEYNYVSNLVDVGGARRLRKGLIPISEIHDQHLICRNFFRLAPNLRLNATGEVTSCPLMGDATGFGNIRKRSLVDILNELQASPLLRLHAERRLPNYRHLLDPDVFGESVDHVCSMRVALTRLALCLGEDPPEQVTETTRKEVNRLVARSMGLPGNPAGS